MKKRLVAGLCAAAFAVGGLGAPITGTGIKLIPDLAVSADEVYTYEDFEYTINSDGTIKLTKYNGNEAILDIPELIDGKNVTSIGEEAFYDCTSLTSITIPNSVKYIGGCAFNGCENLVNIEIPSSVTSINDSTFGSCTSLTSITISDSVTDIGMYAFFGCTSLTSITIPRGVTNIGRFAFSYCTKLTSVKIPDSVMSIGNHAFVGCTSLTSVKLPNSVTNIGDSVFCECGSLTGITIPDSVTSIGRYAFAYCVNLVSITILNNVTSIGADAFDGCKSLKSITIPDTITYIDVYAFSYCPELSDVYYSGIEKQWEEIEILDGNDALKKATIHYIEETPPSIAEISYVPGDNSVNLTWTAIEGAEKYAVCGFVNDKWQKLAEAEGTSYTLKKLKAGTEYKIAVIAKIGGKWEQDFSNAITVTPKAAANTAYPEVTVEYNEQYHQFRLNWTKVPNAQNYGVAVYLAGKWKIQKQDIPATTTLFTSPKLRAGQTYKMVVYAKVDGKWHISNVSKRAFTVTVK